MMAVWNLNKPLPRYLLVCQDAHKTSGLNGLVFSRAAAAKDKPVAKSKADVL